MATVLIQLYRFKAEPYLLRTMAAEFLRQGWRPVFWSNWDQGTDGVEMLPLVFSSADEVMLAGEQPPSPSWTKREAWKALHVANQARYGRLPDAYDIDLAARTAKRILESLRPSLFLCWDGMDSFFGVSKDIACQLGIPTLVWEAGMLGDTLLLDRGGIGPDHTLATHTLPVADAEMVRRGGAYLESTRAKFLSRQAGALQRAVPGLLPRVLVLGGMDISNGVHRPADGRPLALPGYSDGVDLACKVADAHPGVTVFRPHPREPAGPLHRMKGMKVSLDSATPLDVHLSWADVVVGYGSKTDFHALGIGKPFVLAGRGILTGKGVCPEALAPEALPAAIQSAWQNGQTTAEQAALATTFGHLLTHGHYNRSSTGPSLHGIRQLVTDAIGLATRATAISMVSASEARATALSELGHHELLRQARRWRLTRICQRRGRPLEYIKSLRPGSVDTIILDFDHTLLLANSTEEFLAPLQSLPLWGKAAKLLQLLVGGRTRLSVDQFRIAISCLLAPWNVVRWRFRAPRIGADFFNTELWDAIRLTGARTVIVASCGNRMVILPLLRGMQPRFGPTEISLTASRLWPGRDLRVEGKLAAITALQPSIDWARTVAVTDSLDDADLLGKARHGILAQWPAPATTDERRLYYPLRYMAEGKYGSGFYVWRLILGQDLPIFLLTFSSSLETLLAAPLFFLSFQTIYEIGNYENDFVAAAKESSPRVSETTRNFQHYGIHLWAWPWAVGLGAAACWLLADGLGVLRLLTVWVATLGVVRIVFAFYNRTKPADRMALYGLLQLLKSFSPAVILPIMPLGSFLALAHVVQHSAKYWCYRCFGNGEMLPREWIRFTLFAGLGALAWAQGWLARTPSWHVIAVLLVTSLLTLRKAIMIRVRRLFA